MSTPRDEIDRILGLAPPPQQADFPSLVRSAATRLNVPLEVADDYLRVTGGIESGNKHYRNGKVLMSDMGALGGGQLTPDKPDTFHKTVKGKAYDLRDPAQNAEAGLAYFSDFGDDPIARRIGYFSGDSKSLRHYRTTGRIPLGGERDPKSGKLRTSFHKYISVTGGFDQIKPSRDTIDAVLGLSPTGETSAPEEKPTYGVAPLPDLATSSEAQNPATPVPQQPQQFLKSIVRPEPVAIASGSTPVAPDTAPTYKPPEPPEKARPADEFTSKKTFNVPLKPFDKEQTGALGLIGNAGPEAQAGYIDWVRRNASSRPDASLADESYAQTFVKIQQYLGANPKATPEETVKEFAKFGQDFVNDPATKGKQLPKTLHDAMLRAPYGEDELKTLPSKIRQQRAQVARADQQRQAEAALQKQTFDLYRKNPEQLNRNIAWHFGEETLRGLANLPEKTQRHVALMAVAAANEDERKRQAGQTDFQQDPNYQATMRKRAGISDDLLAAATGPMKFVREMDTFLGTAQQEDQQRQTIRQQVQAEQQGGWATRDPSTVEAETERRFQAWKAEQPTEAELAKAKPEIERLEKANYFWRQWERATPELKSFVEKAQATLGRDLSKILPGGVGARLKTFAEQQQSEARVDDLIAQHEYSGDQTILRGIGKEVVQQTFSLVPLITSEAATGIPFPLLMAGQSYLENGNKPASTRLIMAGSAYLMGKAYQKVPGLTVEGLQKIPGAVGELATKYPSVASRIVGAGEFGGLGAGETLARGGTAKQAVISGVAQAIPGAVLAGKPEEPAEVSDARSEQIQSERRSANQPYTASADEPGRVGGRSEPPGVRESSKPEKAARPATEKTEGVSRQPTVAREDIDRALGLTDEPAVKISPPAKAETTASTPSEGGVSVPEAAKTARRILDAYDKTGEISTKREVVKELEKAGLLPEGVAAYRAAEIEHRELGMRMDVPGEVFEAQVWPKLTRLAEGAPSTETISTPSRRVAVPQELIDRATQLEKDLTSATSDAERFRLQSEMSANDRAIGAALSAQPSVPQEAPKVSELAKPFGGVSPEVSQTYQAELRAKFATPLKPKPVVSPTGEMKSKEKTDEQVVPSRAENKPAVKPSIAAAQAKARELQSAPEVRETARTALPGAAGRETDITIPGTNRRYKARYALREADDIEASHNPENFNPNPKYPYTNDRRYESEPQYQTQVINRSKSTGPEPFDPRQLINTSPTIDTGPPAVTEDGLALGGNSRAMIAKRVYRNNPEGAEAYRKVLTEDAASIGIDPAEVAKMKNPVLVREISNEGLKSSEVQRAITDLNVTSTTPLTREEQGAAGARRMSQDSADFISQAIESKGEDATLATVMDATGPEIINRLIADGVIPAGDRNVLIKNGKVTPEAKLRVGRLLTGRVYENLDQMKVTAPSVQNNIERIAPALLQVEGSDWDLIPTVRRALDAVQESKASRIPLDDLNNQASMTRGEPFTAEELSIAKALQMDPRQAATRFRQYANDFETEKNGQSGLFGEPATQAESFDQNFGEAKRGPGAANVGDVPTERTVAQLTDAISKLPKGKSVREAMAAALDTAEKLGEGKDALHRAWLRTVASSKALIVRREVSDYQKSVGEFEKARQRNAFETRQFVKQIKETVPSRLRREAIINYIQADGDNALLMQRAQQSKLRRRLGYEEATRLTDEEKTVANMVSSAWESGWQEARDKGILHGFIENYVTQVWKRKDPIRQKLLADVQRGLLNPTFQFNKQRIFADYFEGEQAGKIPASKDIGDMYATWNQSMQTAIYSRDFIRGLYDIDAVDGRPVAQISGSGKLISKEEAGPEEFVLRPRTKQASMQEQIARKRAGEPSLNIAGYGSVNHSAMHGFKWVTKTADGTPMFMEGDILIHSDHLQQVRNLLGRSAFSSGPLKALKVTQQTIKGTMFGLLPEFHLVQVATHGLGHRILPWNLEKIDFDHPIQSLLVSRGAQIASFDAAQEYGEGLMAGNLLAKIPVLGSRIIRPHQDWLFQDYIPRLKMTMMLDAFERNQKRYGSKLNVDQIAELTAEQGNAAFGEQNWRYLGYHPTTVDAMRTFLLAPDFLLSRGKFVGQAAKPYGREQLVALGVLASTQYLAARIFNKISSGDYHFELENAFKVIIGKKWYGLRSVPGDIVHMISDPRGFFFNRLSPVVATAVEAGTGRDDRGQKKDAAEQIQDFLKRAEPIQFRRHSDDSWWESALNSMGLQEGRYYTPAEEVIRDYYNEKFPGGFPKSNDPEKQKFMQGITKRRRTTNELSLRGVDTTETEQQIQDDIDEAAEAGKLSPDDIVKLDKSGKMTQLQGQMRSLPLEVALDVAEKASPEQKEEIRKTIKLKAQRVFKKRNRTREQKEVLRDRMDKVLE